MNATEASQAVRDGKVVRVTVGADKDDPILLVWAEHDAAECYAVEGWSAGVQETVCEIGSEFLSEFFDRKAKLETIDRPEWLEVSKLR